MSTEIRAAEERDFPRLVEMGRRFVSSSRFGALLPMLGDHIDAIVGAALEKGVVLVAEVDGHIVGMIAFTITGTIAEELAWWVDPEARSSRAGLKLLEACENAVTAKNVTVLKMLAPAASDVGRFLERRGYHALETAYVRHL